LLVDQRDATHKTGEAIFIFLAQQSSRKFNAEGDREGTEEQKIQNREQKAKKPLPRRKRVTLAGA